MTWQRRLAEMVLAGGAIVVVGACSNSSSGGNFCCNANGDPCCAYKNCGGALTPECSCQMAGGTWNYYGVNDAGMSSGACEPAGSEAGASDANASD